jgi:hypothetical protein
MLPAREHRSEAAPQRHLPLRVALACCFGVGGLWLARLPRRALMSGLLPLVLVALIAPARANMPAPNPWTERRAQPVTALYKGAADVTIDEESRYVRLILPTR